VPPKHKNESALPAEKCHSSRPFSTRAAGVESWKKKRPATAPSRLALRRGLLVHLDKIQWRTLGKCYYRALKFLRNMDSPESQSNVPTMKLLQELRQISQNLELLRDEVKQNSITIRTIQERERRDADTDRIGKRAEGNRQYSAQNSIRKATWWAVIAAAIYAGITFLQWRDANSNFKRDEQAWMAFKFSEGSLTLTIGQLFLVPTELVNTGKTPAKNVHGNIVVGVFKKGEHLNFDYSPGHANYKIAAGTIFPGGKIMESFEAIQHGQERAEAIVFNAPLRDDIFNGQSFIVVHGRIVYNDIFGAEHWTTYCRYVLHPELISEDCTRYNDTDDGR
jgi:hypothetical protein